MDLRTLCIYNLKKYRKQKKYSQMKLAELCNTSTSYIGEIEIGRKFPSIEMIEIFCKALEIKPFQLFMDEDDLVNKKLDPEKTANLIKSLQIAIEQIILSEENMQ